MKQLRIKLFSVVTVLVLCSASTFALQMPTTVTGYQQTEEYTCGPAAVMSLMHYYHMLNTEQMTHATELQIAKEMGTSKDTGTSQQQMVTWLQQHGFAVKSGKNGTLDMLRRQLNNGVPVLVDWIDWGGHWVVVSGYNKNRLILADPAAHDSGVPSVNGTTLFSADRFASMWFDSHLVKGIYIIATPQPK